MTRIRRRYFPWLAAVFAGVVTFAQDNPVQTAEAGSYTMLCRGGGIQKLTLSLGLRAKSMYDKKTVLFMTSTYYLKKSKKRYSPKTLGVGECAWTDRPLNNKEPTLMTYSRKTGSHDATFNVTMRPKRTDRFHLKVGGKSQMHRPEWAYWDALNDPKKILELQVRGAKTAMIVEKVRAVRNAP
jgi:hypothetical protein